MSNLNIYPEDMPQALAVLPDLLDGNLAHAAEMVLGAHPGQEGVWACEMAVWLLDKEILCGPKPMDKNTSKKFLRIITSATAYRIQREDDELVFRKLSFFLNILYGCISTGRLSISYLKQARIATMRVAEIFQRQLDAEEEQRGVEADNVA